MGSLVQLGSSFRFRWKAGLVPGSLVVVLCALLGLTVALSLVSDRSWQVSIETGLEDRELQSVFLSVLQDRVHENSNSLSVVSGFLVVTGKFDDSLQSALNRSWWEAEKATIEYADQRVEFLRQAEDHCKGEQSGCLVLKDLEFLAHEMALPLVSSSLESAPEIRAEMVPRGYGPSSEIVVLAGFAGGAGVGVFISYLAWFRKQELDAARVK